MIVKGVSWSNFLYVYVYIQRYIYVYRLGNRYVLSFQNAFKFYFISYTRGNQTKNAERRFHSLESNGTQQKSRSPSKKTIGSRSIVPFVPFKCHVFANKERFSLSLEHSFFREMRERESVSIYKGRRVCMCAIALKSSAVSLGPVSISSSF